MQHKTKIILSISASVAVVALAGIVGYVVNKRKKLKSYFSVADINIKHLAFDSEEYITNVENLIKDVLAPVRHIYGKPIFISSGYRNQAYNAKVGGVKNSQHLIGQAVDIQPEQHNTKDATFRKEQEELFNAIVKNGNYDQLLLEQRDTLGHRWIHVSWRGKKGDNRKKIILMNNDKTDRRANQDRPNGDYSDCPELAFKNYWPA